MSGVWTSMTVTVAKEKDNFLSAVRLFAERRGDSDPAWLEKLRLDAAARFEQLEFPTTRDEEWKYTNVAPLLKLPFRHGLDIDSGGATAESLEPVTFSEARGSLLVFINGQ